MISKEEITQLGAGRELDIAVAEQVMGWQIETNQARVKRLTWFLPPDAQGRWWRTSEGGWDNNPLPYSSNLSAAWRVVEMMVSRGRSFFLVQSGAESRVAFGDSSAAAPEYVVERTVMMAVCKAALASTSLLTRGGVPEHNHEMES